MECENCKRLNALIGKEEEEKERLQAIVVKTCEYGCHDGRCYYDKMEGYEGYSCSENVEENCCPILYPKED